MANPDRIAVKTLWAIDEAIRKDQGAVYRGHLGRVIPQMKDAYNESADTFRSHLGASTLGTKCPRAIWYNFRWATKSNHAGRVIRLFNRGHLEEARFIAMLLTIGVTVYQQDENGNQYRITGASGHYGGSGDGVGIRIPDLDSGTYALLEFKTHNDASFKKLVLDGLRASKFEHYVQMQQYMQKMGLAAGLYCAVNKNNDDLYMCIVTLDKETAETFIERGNNIVWLKRAPDRIGSPPSPGNFDCKWCDHKPVCFLKQAPDQNCRTCSFSEPMNAPEAPASWQCNKHAMVISKEIQLTGCTDYTRHPDMGS